MEIKQYFLIVKKRLWIIVACVLIAVVTTFYYTDRYIQPVYQASTKLVVNTTVGKVGNEQIDFGTLGFNLMLIETYKEIIRTPAILNKVVERHPELHLTTEQLARIVSVGSLDNTQVMTVTALDMNYARAATIVNTVSEVFKNEIPHIMKVNNVTILNEAPLNSNPLPINQAMNKNLMLSFAVSLLFSIALVFLLEYLDDTLKSEEDIHQVLGVPTLAAVVKLNKKDLKGRNRGPKVPAQLGGASYADVNR